MRKKNQAIISILLTVCVLMLLLPIGIGEVYADPGDVDDVTPPSITQIVMESGTFGEGDSFTVTVYATDEESGIPQKESGIVRLFSNNEDGPGSISTEERLRGNGSGVYTATFNVDGTWISGDYQIELADIYDNEGNHKTIRISDDAELIPDTIVHINTSNTDREGPQIYKIEAESAEVSVGDYFKIRVFALDQSGVEVNDPGIVEVSRIKQDDEFQQIKTASLIPISENQWEAEFVVDEHWVAGEYVISFVSMHDTQGFTTYIWQGTEQYDQLIPDVTYTVLTDNTDAIAPIITSAEMESAKVGLGESFTVKIYADRDEDLSDECGNIWVYRIGDVDDYFSMSAPIYKTDNGEYEATFIVTDEWLLGQYKVAGIQLWDSNDNTGYVDEECVQEFPLGTITVDYEPGPVDPPEPDIKRPEITKTEFDKTSYVEGDSLVVLVSTNNRDTALDRENPGWVRIRRTRQDGEETTYFYGEPLVYVDAGECRATFDVSRLLSGDYNIEDITINDTEGYNYSVNYYDAPEIVSQNTVNVASNYTDPTPPTIEKVEIETQTVQDGESFEVVVFAHDNESGISVDDPGEVLLSAEEGWGQFSPLVKVGDNKYTATFTVDYWPAKDYTIELVRVRDAQGNECRIFRDDEDSLIPDSIITAVTDNNDFDPPVLTSVSIGNDTSAGPGETIEVFVEAHDEQNEIEKDYPGYVMIARDGKENEVGAGYLAELHEVSDSLYKAVFEVRDDWYAGNYHVDEVNLRDDHGNFLYYDVYDDDEENLLPKDVILISTSRTDATEPVVTKVEVPDLGELYVGDTFEVRVYGTDNGSISEEYPGDVFIVNDAQGVYYYEPLVKDDGFYKATTTITKNWKPGAYYIASAALVDNCDNRGILWSGIDDFPRVSFTVVNDDYEEPIIPEPEPSDGWVMDNDGFRYEYADGSYPVDEWDFIQDKWYHFDEQGYMQSGWLKLDDNWYYLNLTDFEGMAIGWKEINKVKYFFSDSGIMQTGWKKLDNVWYYFRSNGALATGWVSIDDKWYYFNDNGEMQTGWKQVDDTWYYLNQSGSMLTGWGQIDGQWYYFNDNGEMQTGWQKVNGVWYYFNQSGSMRTGWGKIDGIWYYFNPEGSMATGWKQINSNWYYFNQSGSMLTGWGQIGGKWYYFNSDGVMQSGWQKINNVWYYFDNSGSMATGWRQIKNTWYYLDQSGAMVSGWRQINGDWYYFNSDGSMVSGKWVGDYYLTESGAMATDQWIGNYYVDSNGKWVPDKKK